MMRKNSIFSIAATALFAAAMAGSAALPALADPTPATEPSAAAAPSIDDQYQTVANARTKAELGARHAQEFFESNEDAWRQAYAGAETARNALNDFLNHAIDAENRKPDEQRNQTLIDTYVATRSAIDSDWTKYASLTRPSIESAYRRDQNLIRETNDLFQNLVNLERGWKDVKLDLPLLASNYQMLADRADELQSDAARQLGQLQDAQKTWENSLQSATKPPAPGAGG